MPTTDTNAVKSLKQTIGRQKETISDLHTRISALADEIVMLRNEMSRFKQDVAADINELYEKQEQ